MGKGLFVVGLLFIALLIVVSAAAIENTIPIQIQTVDGSGNVVTGTFEFTINISNSDTCSPVLYSNVTTLTTDARGVVFYNLLNVDLTFSEQYWFCYYRDGVLKQTSKAARSPYTFTAKNVSAMGIINDSNFNLAGYNLTGEYGFFNGMVGIGTTSPVGRLHVTRQIVNDESSQFAISKFNSQGVTWATDTSLPSLIFNADAAIRPEIAWIRGTRTYPEFAIRQHATLDKGGTIYSGTGLVAPTATMSFYAGNVGIGNTAPDYTLTINGSTAPFKINNASGSQRAWFSLANDDADMYLKNRSDDIRVGLRSEGDSYILGDVGIGTTTPDSKLNVYSVANPAGKYLVNITNLDPTTAEAYGLLVRGGADAAASNILEVQDYTGNTDFIIKGGGNVGIGTDAPSGKFEVVDTGGTITFEDNRIERRDSDTDNAALWLNYQGYEGGSTRFRDTVIGDGKTNDVLFVDGSAGRVGIGTASPQTELDISDSNVLTLRLSDTRTALGEGDLTHKIEFHSGELSGGGAGVDSAIYINRSGANADWAEMSFYTGSVTSFTERMRIDNVGNVGIGTSSPSRKLQVEQSTTDWTGWFENTHAEGAGVYIKGVSVLAADSLLSIAANDGATTVMDVQADGNVGIGTPTPGRKLDVQGVQGWETSTAERAYLNPSATGADFALRNASAITIRFDARSNADSYFNSGGNVGIGTASPQTELHISGSSPELRITDTDASSVEFQIDASGTSAAIIKTNTAHDIGFYTPTNGRIMTLSDSDGHVGIGTASPSTKLQVAGDILVEDVRGAINISGTGGVDTATINFQIENPADTFTTRYQIQFDNSNNKLYFLDESDKIMTFDTSRRVGIGTTSPSYNLDVFHPTTDILANFTSGDVAGDIIIGDSQGSYSRLRHTNGDFQIFKESSVYITAKDGGNVGIGTDSPEALLQVQGNVAGHRTDFSLDTNEWFNMGHTSGYGSIQWFVKANAANDGFVNTHATVLPSLITAGSGVIAFYTAPTNAGSGAASTLMNRMVIDSSGDVGIGTDSPNQKLQVAGNVNISGDLWVQGQNMTIPDYVFEEDYNLMNLEDLELYIGENNKLPDSEIQGSFETASLNTKQLFLLEKVEEQTLYILDLKEENDALMKKSERMAEDLCSLGIVRWC